MADKEPEIEKTDADTPDAAEAAADVVEAEAVVEAAEPEAAEPEAAEPEAAEPEPAVIEEPAVEAEPEVVAEAEPAAEAAPAEPEAAVEEVAVEEPVVEAEPEAPVEEAAAEEPVAEEAASEPVAEAAAPPEEEPAAPPAVSGPKKKRKRLPRSLRHKHSKPARERDGERKPIERTPPAESVPGRRQERRGVVVSDKGDKSIVVKVEMIRAHPKYKKVVRRSRRLQAHDEQNTATVGDVVRIVETRPLSKTKRWRLAEIVEKAK